MRHIQKSFCDGKKLLTTLLLALILLGVTLGVWLVCSESAWEYLYSPVITQGFIVDYSQKTILDVFIDSYVWTGILLVVIHLCGFCAIAQPLTIGFIFSRGVALGISISSMYLEYGSKGVLMYILAMMFHVVVTSIVLVFATVDSLGHSNLMLYTALERSFENFKLKKYNHRLIIRLVIVLLSSIMNTCLLHLCL
jgi:hypothetical protein